MESSTLLYVFLENEFYHSSKLLEFKIAIEIDVDFGDQVPDVLLLNGVLDNVEDLPELVHADNAASIGIDVIKSFP